MALETPACKRKYCSNPCQYYGSVGGFSVQCKLHNIEDANKRRVRSKRRREQLRK